jgi:hypothetical protein
MTAMPASIVSLGVASAVTLCHRIIQGGTATITRDAFRAALVFVPSLLATSLVCHLIRARSVYGLRLRNFKLSWQRVAGNGRSFFDKIAKRYRITSRFIGERILDILVGTASDAIQM